MATLKRFNSISCDDGHLDTHYELDEIALVFKDPGPEFHKPSLEAATVDPLPPVDGGIKAWSAIGGGFLALFVQFGLGKWWSD